MRIQKLTIVGVGLLGGSIGLAVRARGLADEVVGVEQDALRCQEARDRGAVDRCEVALEPAVQGADLVVLATPVSVIQADLVRLAPLLEAGTVVTDVGSVKAAITAAGSALSGAFVPGHPMAGGTHGGVGAARAALFEGATWALTPDATTSAAARARVTGLVEALGARPLVLSATEHDRFVATTSHLPHLLAYALSATARAHGAPEALEGPSFRDATRVAASAPAFWREICLRNQDALGESLSHCRERLQAMEEALRRGDGDALERLFLEGERRKN